MRRRVPEFCLATEPTSGPGTLHATLSRAEPAPEQRTLVTPQTTSFSLAGFFIGAPRPSLLVFNITKDYTLSLLMLNGITLPPS